MKIGLLLALAAVAVGGFFFVQRRRAMQLAGISDETDPGFIGPPAPPADLGSVASFVTKEGAGEKAFA